MVITVKRMTKLVFAIRNCSLYGAQGLVWKEGPGVAYGHKLNQVITDPWLMPPYTGNPMEQEPQTSEASLVLVSRIR